MKRNPTQHENKKDTFKQRTMQKKPAQREKLSPAEVWKNAAKLLETKKKESPHKSYDQCSIPDFNSIKARIQEINNERIASFDNDLDKGTKKFMQVETANSLLHIPDFDIIEHKFIAQKPIRTPECIPKVLLTTFDNPDMFKKLDIDTLFFIFYSQPNTSFQYYAAMQLKAYSWRYHTKYATWFQRLDEPKLITADYERGDFLFFDYDATWSFMKKSDFTFEYKYLECAEF